MIPLRDSTRRGEFPIVTLAIISLNILVFLMMLVTPDLESFILYNDSGLNDVDSQLVEIKDVPEIYDCVRTILD